MTEIDYLKLISFILTLQLTHTLLIDLRRSFSRLVNKRSD